MNKPIIIDGVDVSECRYYRNGSCKIETLTPCPYYKDCYYKQLQRLKAENEELKGHNETLVYNCEKFREGNILLKQALEEVREIANKRDVGCGKFCEVNRKEHNCNAECNAYYLKQIQDKINEVLKDE